MSNPQYKTLYAEINGIRYAYHSEKMQHTNGVIVLVHGWPDTSYSFRYLMPVLIQNGYHCISVDNAGFGNTTCSDDLQNFTLYTAAINLRCLLESLGIKKAIWIGHDWGSLVSQYVLWFFPEYVQAMAVVSVPFMHQKRIPFRDLAKTVELIPSFKYQLFLAKDDSSTRIFQYGLEAYLRQVYSNGKEFFGLSVKNPPLSNFISQKELDIYVDSFRKTLKQSNFWYKTHPLNYDNERKFKGILRINVPGIFIGGVNDPAVPPKMWKGQSALFSNSALFKSYEFQAGHWVLWEYPKETSEIILQWLQGIHVSKL